MLANTKQTRKIVNDTLNSVLYNYCNKTWTDRDHRTIDDGKRIVVFEIMSNNLDVLSREIKQRFINAGFDNRITVSQKYIRIASIL